MHRPTRHKPISDSDTPNSSGNDLLFTPCSRLTLSFTFSQLQLPALPFTRSTMLRQAVCRLSASGSHRSLSTSPNLLKSKRPSESHSHSHSPSSPRVLGTQTNPPTTPSPAETPRRVPESISPAPPFEPIVNRPASAASTPSVHQEIPTAPLSSPVPITTVQPAPEPPTNFDLSKLPSLDIEPGAALPEPGKVEGRRTGAGRKEYVSSIERQRRAYFRYGLGALVLGGLGAVYFAGQGDGRGVGRVGTVIADGCRFRRMG